jgi:ADP-ribose pyrophosphatase YjhB (NUDIX family)
VTPDLTIRHFTVAVFVVHEGRVLLHFHPKIGRWLPPGGHVEPNELPDDAAVREVEEETGVRCELVGGRGVAVERPRQLVMPAGIQLEDIEPGHQHIDLVYFARPRAGGEVISAVWAETVQARWTNPADFEAMGVDAEIRAWCARVVAEIET